MIIRTFSYIKPDAEWADGLIMHLIQEAGFIIKDYRKVQLKLEDAEFLYNSHKGKHYYEGLIAHTLSGTVTLLLISGIGNTVEKFRELIGATNPANAEVGTIRFDYGTPNGGPANAIHGSDSIERAIEEIRYFFPEEEI